MIKSNYNQSARSNLPKASAEIEVIFGDSSLHSSPRSLSNWWQIFPTFLKLAKRGACATALICDNQNVEPIEIVKNEASKNNNFG